MPKLLFTKPAAKQLDDLKIDAKKLKRVRRCLCLLEQDPKHAGLQSHKYGQMKGGRGEDVWQSYVENKTPAAWRVFWHYGPDPSTITIVAITPHP